MKKIAVFLFLIILLAFALHYNDKTLPLFSLYSAGTCEFTVVKDTNKNIPSFASSITCGQNLFIKADISLGGYLQKQLKDILGVTIVVNDDISNVLKNLQIKISKSELQNENTHIFGFSPLFEKSVFIGGKKCNMHIVIQKEHIIIGYPIILGSY